MNVPQFDSNLLTRQSIVVCHVWHRNIKKEKATIIPSLKANKPGVVLRNNELLDLFATKFGPEVLDVSNSDFRYIQKVDWSLYTNPHHYFMSER